jgi:tetratricopeptide (TPR) repeat protein
VWFAAEHPNLFMVAHGAVWLGLDEEAWQLAVAIEPLHALAGTLLDWLAITQVALGAAGRASDRTGYARVQMTRASALTLARRNDEAVGALLSALAAFDAARDLPGMIDAKNRLGLIHRAERDLDSAEDIFHAVAEKAEQAGLALWHAQALENIGETAATGGAYEKAQDYAEQALAAFTAVGAHPSMTVGPLLVLARAARETGQLPAAAQHTARAEAALGNEPTASRWLMFAVLFEKAAQARAADHAHQAHEAYLRCAELAGQLRDRPREIRARTAIADTLIPLGRPREAADLARSTANLARTRATPYDTATALRVLAHALTATGHADEAADARREAARMLETYTDPAATRLHTELLAEP